MYIPASDLIAKSDNANDLKLSILSYILYINGQIGIFMIYDNIHEGNKFEIKSILPKKDLLLFSKCRYMLYPLMCSNLSEVRLHT